MIRILVIQLARLGDLIQTTPLLRDLLAGDSRTAVDVLIFDSQRELLNGLGVGTIYSLSERQFPEGLRAMDVRIERSRARLEPAPPEALESIRRLALPRYDRILNCTYSPLGALIGQQLEARQAGRGRFAGPVITRDGEVLFRHPAHVYLRARAHFRCQNWFNLVDIWRATAPPARTPPGDCRPHVAVAAELPFELPKGRIVALNPGSSEKRRRWSPADFALLAERLNQKGLVPVLVGAAADREVCAEVRGRSAIRILDLSGRTSVGQLALLLSHAELIVSNDTGAIHVAAAVGCRVLALFGATAYFAETAPWSAGNVILQGPLESDGVGLAGPSVEAAALYCLGLIGEDRLRHEIVPQSVTAWETCFLPSSADPLGGLAYRPLHRTGLSEEETFTLALRSSLARTFWEWGKNAASQPLGGEKKPYWSESKRVRTLLKDMGIAPFIEALESMAFAAGRCRDLTARPTRQNSCEIQDLAATLIMAMDELKEGAEGHPLVKPVVHFLDWQCRMMPPMDPESTFRAHEQAYRAAAQLLYEAVSVAYANLCGDQEVAV